MLEINILRADRQRVKEGLTKRNFSAERLKLVDDIIDLDDQRKLVQTNLDQLLAMVNTHSKEIGALFKSGKSSEAEAIKQKVVDLKTEIKELESKQTTIIDKIESALIELPNIPHFSVRQGKGEDDNEVFKAWNGAMPDFSGFEPLPHWDLAEKHNIIDLKLGVKLTGSGFPVFRGKGAKLERALINFFLDEAEKAGYEEIMPPLMVNEDTARATGQLPDKEGQMYHIERDNFYLIPTAEVPVTNILRGEILAAEDLPVKLTGYTPCFRREAGSYGADVKGLNRVHQFDKVEIVQISHPDQSYSALEQMLDHVEQLLTKLELPYRILRLCGGDLGFTSALTFDFEVYSAAQKRWLEVSSVSNFETFQSNRLKLRYRELDSKPQLVHTLNGSALALARIVAAILENNQDQDGVNIPAVLQKFTGFERI